MQDVSGYVVLDKAGEFIAFAGCIITAIGRMKIDPLARRVERCSDGQLMAGFPRKKTRDEDPWAPAVMT